MKKLIFLLCLISIGMASCGPGRDSTLGNEVVFNNPPQDSIYYTLYRATNLKTGRVEPAYIRKDGGMQVYMTGDTVEVNGGGFIPSMDSKSDSLLWHEIILKEPRGIYKVSKKLGEVNE